MRQRQAELDYIGIFLLIIRAVILILVVWGSISAILDNPYTTSQWTDFVIFGISQGSMYALIAIGYTLVYGVFFQVREPVEEAQQRRFACPRRAKEHENLIGQDIQRHILQRFRAVGIGEKEILYGND